MNIAVVIYTYNRIDDAKINMEVIRKVWVESKLFKDIKIIHSFNGDKKWYPKKYLEDSLVVTKNKGHFQGASDLLDAGFSEILRKKWDVDYVIFLASDTWLIKPEFVNKIIQDMKSKNLYLATNSWGGLPGKPESLAVRMSMAVDFFVIDYNWAKKTNIFPLDYGAFKDKYNDLFYYQGANIMLERLFISHFLRAIHKETKSDVEFISRAMDKIRIIIEREPVHEAINEKGMWVRKMYWPEIGLLTHHKPIEKQKVLKDLNLKLGGNWDKLIEAKDLSYFNSGFISTQSTN